MWSGHASGLQPSCVEVIVHHNAILLCSTNSCQVELRSSLMLGSEYRVRPRLTGTQIHVQMVAKLAHNSELCEGLCVASFAE